VPLPEVGMFLVEKDIDTGQDIRYWRIIVVEPAMFTTIEYPLTPATYYRFPEVPDMLELKDDYQGLYLRIGVITGWWSVRYPRSVDERWGVWAYRDPEAAIKELKIIGWLTPETSPENDPSPESEVWLLRYPERNSELFPIALNPTTHVLLARAKLFIWRFKFEQATAEQAAKMLEKRPEMVVPIFYPKTTR